MGRITNTEELSHHGILGMKWGVRRYQNKDGTLTPAGKKKAAKMKDEYTALTGKRLIRKPTPKNQNGKNAEEKKTRKQMTDEELTNKINRLQKEKQLMGLEADTAGKGQKFVSTVGKQVIAPAAIDAGKRVLTDWLVKVGSDAAGLNKKQTKSALDELKEEATKSRLKKQIEQDKDWFANRNKETTNSNNSTSSNDKKESRTETVTGTIFDSKSSSNSSSNSSKAKEKVIIDNNSLWREVSSDSTALAPYRKRGKEYLGY